MINQILLITSLLLIIVNIIIAIDFIKNSSWIFYISLSHMNKLGKIVCSIGSVIIFPIAYLIYGIYLFFDFIFHL